LKTKDLIRLVFFLLLAGTTISALGIEGGEENKDKEKGESEEAFDASTFIMEHIADSHEWHILTKKNGESMAIYLPVILYSNEKGLDIFSSRKLFHGNIYKGYKLEEEEGDLKGKIVSVNAEGLIDEENLPLDFSITKTVVGLFSAAAIGLLLFLSLARSYKKTGISHPKGIQSFLEPIILFVRDDIAISNIGEHKYEKYMPYLLTVFFFHTHKQHYGTHPFPSSLRANVTGNIAVTFVLAVLHFLLHNSVATRLTGVISLPHQVCPYGFYL